jgi:hypothetical protein
MRYVYSLDIKKPAKCGIFYTLKEFLKRVLRSYHQQVFHLQALTIVKIEVFPFVTKI